MADAGIEVAGEAGSYFLSSDGWSVFKGGSACPFITGVTDLVIAVGADGG